MQPDANLITIKALKESLSVMLVMQGIAISMPLHLNFQKGI